MNRLKVKRATCAIGLNGVILYTLTTMSLGQSVHMTEQPLQSPPDHSQLSASATPAPASVPKIPNDQLDSLVAPIALYPDPLLSQTLVAATYPLEIIQLEQFLKRNANLKDQALADAVEKQPWDPSIQAMATFPDVLNRMAQNLTWTTDLGNAFLSQQSDVMAAVQRMRAKAQSKGTLKTSAEQVVKTEAVDGQEFILVEQANPQYVYVPSYDPMIVYGALPYPYYPYYYSGYYSGMGLAFGTGLILGAAWGNGWGYHPGWGNGDVQINHNNKYVNHYNKQNNISNANKNWQHNPQHRGGAPYGDRNTANKYGGRARQQPAGGTANRPSGGMRAGAGNTIGNGIADRSGGVGNGNAGGGNIGSNRPSGGVGGAASRPGSGTGSRLDSDGIARPSTRPSNGSGSNFGGDRGGSGGSRLDSEGIAKPSTRPSNGSSSNFGGERGGGGSDRVGGHHTSVTEGGGSLFGGGGGGGFGGNSYRASSNRGSHSMGGGGFGGGGGGGRGGGGGGRRR